MKFDKSRVYTVLNADELKVGSKVVCGDTLLELRQKIEAVQDADTLEFVTEELIAIKNESYQFRFITDDTYLLAYFVEEPGKLNWTDLKIGDIITNGHKKAMVTAIDLTACDNCHINVGYKWLTDKELEEWEKSK